MQSVSSTIFVYFCLALATTLVYSGHSFTAQVQVTNSRTTSTLFGKRERALKKVKKIFKGDNTPVADETDSNVPSQQIELSNGRAKDLAKKYKDIDDLGERAYEVLVDLNMVGRS